MFTGIVTAVGTVAAVRPADGGLELTIASPYPDLSLGESIAVDGACLTVQALPGAGADAAGRATVDAPGAAGTFVAHVIRTSLDRTAFADYRPGRRVNLERALRAGDRLGGHLVQGHVDGVGTVEQRTRRDDAVLLDIRVPPAVAEVSIPLGSITVDGVSLTVNAQPAPAFIQVSLIPFTLQHTTLGDRRPGDRVHVEGDTIGKYVRGLLPR